MFLVNGLTAQDLLTFEEALKITLEANYDIKIAEKKSEIAKNNTSIYNSDYLPKVIGQSNANYSKGNSNSEFQDGTINSVDGFTSKNYSASIGLNYTLFNGFYRKYSIKSLKEKHKLTELEAREVIENTILGLSLAYHEVARLTLNKTNQEKALEISNQRLQRAKYSFKYGQSSKLDILNAEVDISNDSIVFLDIKRQLANAKRDLNIVLGENIETDFLVNTNVNYQQELNLDKLLRNAIANNVSLLQAKSTIEQSKYDIKLNKSNWLPSLDLSTSYAWSKTQEDAITQFRAVESYQNGLNAGVSLSWNIFDGGKTKIKTQNSKINLDIQQINKESLEEKVKRDIINAWDVYQVALLKLNMQKKNVATNQRNFERTNEQFKLGQITSLDFRNAQLNLLNAQSNLNAARFEAKNSELQLLQLAGMLL